MNSFLKYGLIAGGAYLLFHQQISDVIERVKGETTGADTTGSSDTPATTQTTVPAPPIKQLVAAAAANDANMVAGLMEFARWNVYYKQIRGVDGPAVEDAMPGTDPNRKISIDEWWDAAAKAGLSGLGQVRRKTAPLTPAKSAARRAWGY